MLVSQTTAHPFEDTGIFISLAHLHYVNGPNYDPPDTAKVTRGAMDIELITQVPHVL